MKARKDSKGRALRKGETVRRNTGMYQYAYLDKAGKRQYIYSHDLVTLRQKEEEILRDILDGIDGQIAKTQSLNDIFDKYMATRKDLADRTYAGYLYQYNAYVRRTLGKRKIKDIRYSDILSFYINLMAERKLSYGTIEHLQRELHPAFEMALRDCIIRTNPTDHVLGQIKRQTGATRGVRNALTPEQQRAFLQYMEGHPVYDHWKPIYTFFVGTGVRVGELSGLTWQDVDFDNGYITIDHAVVYFAGKLNTNKKRIYITKPKTEAGIRKIPMVPEVRNSLKEVKRYQQEQGIVCNTEVDGYTDFVFLNRFGNIFLQQALDRALKRIIDAYNDEALHKAAARHKEAVLLPQFTCHTLRHTFCARFCENETNLKVIQSVMGHVDIATTMNIYAEVSDTRKKQSMEKLTENMKLF